MFHLILTSAYIIPNIYVYARVNQLFISKGYKKLYTVIYLVLFAIYPLVGNFGEHSSNLVLRYLSVFTGYLLPFYLYLFLFVLLFDLFLLLNLIFRFVSKEKRKSYRFRKYVFSAIIILSAIIVIGGAINLNTIRVSEYRVTLPRKKSDMNNLRVVFVSDFHIQQTTRPRFIKQFVDKVNQLNPDVMLFGGDIVEGNGENETTNEVESLFKSIKSKYGSFGVTGNHEFYGGQENGSFFRKAGITMLYDTVISINNEFYIAGRYDEHFRNRKTVNELLKDVNNNLPIILLDHRPTQLQQVSQTNTDVQFSGHTHYGQLFPINFIINRIYELSWGTMKKGNTHFFVSSGIRLWGPPVKTAGKSELMLVDFSFD